MNFLAVACGGAIGSLARYALILLLPTMERTLFPWPTFLANITGCLCIGFLYRFSDRSKLSATVRLGIGTGVLGGFTTFSAFNLELLNLSEMGHPLLAFSYMLLSLTVGLVFCGLGIALANKLVTPSPITKTDR